MKLKYTLVAIVAIVCSIHYVCAADNDVQKQNIARLAVLYEAYKAETLGTEIVAEPSDVTLLKDHIVLLNMEKEKLGGFVRRSVIPGLYKAGGFTAGALFGPSTAVLGVSGAAIYANRRQFNFFEGIKMTIDEVATGRRGHYRIDPGERLIMLGILSAPFISLLSGVGMERMFTWASQYSQKRAERLQAIEENLKLDQEILAKL